MTWLTKFHDIELTHTEVLFDYFLFISETTMNQLLEF